MVSQFVHQASGGCHCDNIRVDIGLTAAPGNYRPRACDCDFCRKHGAAWLSDAKGSLRIHINDPRERGSYRQGSEQAELLLCRKCGVLVGVMHQIEQRMYAAINVRVVHDAVQFGAEQTVSPQKLSPNEKVNRWRSLWFADVQIHSVGSDKERAVEVK